jgi:putative membrane-bound dehydrogenase-like protein
MIFARAHRAWPVLLTTLVLGLAASARGALPRVPEGFEVRLVATVPAVLYPCQVATAPDGALFVAEDPMDQIGPYEAKHGRILLFRDGKDPVPFADGFRAIQGMAWYEGSLYVSHMPFLTVIRDTDGDDKADTRKDLFTDIGPTNNQGLNDHIVSGLQFGMDGYLYISVGDKGIPKATGPDGRTIQIKGGGTCRCRPDGTGLEVYSTGTRNHLEPNLDDRDNLFTYDNTDDGLGWWTRVTHHVDGGYFGYPYDYHDRTDRMLPRMGEYGGGSPCGGVIYKEDVWPEKYRNVGFWAEWGKGKVHAFRFAPDGSTFKIAEVIDFAVPNGVSNFRPIDLAISYDGRTMYVADWNMGGWGNKTEKVGRVFAITWKGEVQTRPRGKDSDSIEDQIKQLDHPSFNERMRAQRALIKKGREAQQPAMVALLSPKTNPIARRHLVWVIDGIQGGALGAEAVLSIALRTAEPEVLAQAARALGERRENATLAGLLPLLRDRDPVVRLQAIIALGRIGDEGAIPNLFPLFAEEDRYLAFSARQALRRINHWEFAGFGLVSTDPKVRQGTLAAMETVYEPGAVELLRKAVRGDFLSAEERARALTYLAQVHRKAKPWDGKWWGTRPALGKPPARVVDWEGTPIVLQTIRESLADPAVPVRLAAVSAVEETNDRESLPTLRERFATDTDLNVRRTIAKTLGTLDDKEALPVLIATFRDAKAPEPLRSAALASVEDIGTETAVNALVEVLDSGALADEQQLGVVAALGRFKAKPSVASLGKLLESPSPAIRAAAATALGKIGELKGVDASLRSLLNDSDLKVREATILALGELKDREAIPTLLIASKDPETRYEATVALAAMPDVLALPVYLRGLADRSPDLRKVSAEALGKIRDQAAPVLEQLAKRNELSPSLVPELVKIYSPSRPLTGWRILGPFKIDDKLPVSPEGPIDLSASLPGIDGKPMTWRRTRRVAEDGGVDLNRLISSADDVAALAYVEIEREADQKAAMAVGSDDTLTVWLNGKQVYDFQDRRGFKPDDKQFDVALVKGTNRVLVKCGNRGGPWMFGVALTTPSDYAFLKTPKEGGFNPEKFRAFALKEKGQAEHGRALFHDLKGLACIKCHTVGGQGGTVGPELSSVGAKYPRDELITSVLFPSDRISSGYEPIVVATADGRLVTGIVKTDTADAFEIEDADAKRIKIAKSDIDEQRRSEVSIMPNGLAEGLTPQDFADLIAYLESLKEVPKTSASGSGGR